jgi:serine/threonine protein kinase/WD40 repeat protein
MTDDNSSDANPFDVVAEEFVARHRRGETPSVGEYAANYPELADEIRELFPGLILMEQLRPGAQDSTESFSPALARPYPQRLGDYRLLREVGRGGMGVVYEAEQVSLGRHVALKVLPGHGLLNPTFLERFHREARAAARLHHTNIVPVFGVGEDKGVHFYAMQFIQGQGLDQVLHDLRRLRKHSGTEIGCRDLTTAFRESAAQGLLTGQFKAPLTANPGGPALASPPSAPTNPAVPGSATGLSGGGSVAEYYRSVARVGQQAADALGYAHRQGVLHRDIKPSNLLLDQQGTVWITDFGLAKAEGSGDLTEAGDIVGTVRFMAPERFEGRSLPQSDIYSLGLTLYELLTLQPPFDDTNKAQLVERILREPPPSLRRFDPHIPRDLETIVLKCVAKDVTARYATAEALAEDLRRFLTDRPIRARRAGLAERLGRWCRRNPLVATLTATVAVLLVTVAVVSMVAAGRLQTALAQTRAAEREARLREAEALVGQAHGIRCSRRPGQRFEALATLEKAARIGRELNQPPEWFDAVRNEAIAALALPDLYVTQSWDGFPPGTFEANVSDDFEWYARTTEKGDCSIRRIVDDTEVARLPTLGEPARTGFGGGRLLVLFGEQSRQLQLWDLRGDEPLLRLKEKNAENWDFCADSRKLAISSLNGSIAVYETSTGACQYQLPPHEVRLPLIALHPSEPFIAVTSYHTHGCIQVRDLRTGDVSVSQRLPWRGSGGCAWTRDGHSLAVSDGNSGLIHLYSFDLAPPALRLTRTMGGGSGNGGTSVHFNAAGDRLVTCGWEGVVRLFDVHTGRQLFSTPALTRPSSRYLHYDLSGNRLAAVRVGEQQERIGVWSIAEGREYRAFGRAGPSVLRPAIHPSGRLAVQGYSDGLQLYDLETGREVEFVKLPRGCTACFDGVGNLLSNGFGGFLRWPVQADPATPGRLILGPPERLPFKPGNRELAASSDGQVIAQAMFNGYGMAPYAGGWIVSPSSPEPRRVNAGVSTSGCDVSPDGRLVAFGLHYVRVNVYEASTGRCVWQSPIDRHFSCRFSRDGHWLVTDSDGGRAYAVGTWERGPRLGPGTPWDVSPDGRVAVLGLTDGVLRLVELTTGRELARLEDPERLAGPAVFTPDGTHLVVRTDDGLRVWDLRRIRTELVKLGLDWDAPSFPDPLAAASGLLEVHVIP